LIEKTIRSKNFVDWYLLSNELLNSFWSSAVTWTDGNLPCIPVFV